MFRHSEGGTAASSESTSCDMNQIARVPTTAILTAGAAVLFTIDKCRESREIQNARPETMKNGRPANPGNCGVCGATMFRMGKTS